MPLKITTNHHWHNFKTREEVPPSILANEFDWTDEDDLDGFFCYRGTWYHVSEFMRHNGEPKGWDGAHGDSYFSGVLIRVSEDGEQYQIATCYVTSEV